MLGFVHVPVFTFRPLRSPAAPPPGDRPVPVKTNLIGDVVLRDPDVLFVVSLSTLAHRRVPWCARPASNRCP